MSVPLNETPTPPPPVTGVPSAEEKQWAMFAHLSGLVGALLTGIWFGWGCFIGPLIIWLIKKDTMPFVNDQAKQALNFCLTLAIAELILLVFAIMTFGIGLLIAWPLGVILGIAWLVFTIIAAIKANEGVAYRYPVSLHLIK